MRDVRAAARRAGLLAAAVALVLALAGIFQHDLWTSDEPREAEIGREMLLSGFSSVPTLAGEPFLEKPPLFAWSVAASYRAFGVSAGAARIPSVVFALGALAVAFQIGRLAGGRIAGLCCVVVLATMIQFVQTTHKAILDTALLFFVSAGHLAFLRLRNRCDALGLAGVGLCAGLAFLSKTWVGPGLVCAPPLLAALVLRDGAFLRRTAPRAVAAAVLGVVALGLPWVLSLASAPAGGWARVQECLVTQTLGRAVAGVDDFERGAHYKGALFYAPVMLGMALPWTLAVPALCRNALLSRGGRSVRTAWCALVFVSGVVLLSVPAGKRDLYLVPLMPALAAAVGVWLSRVGSRRGGPWDRGTLCILAGGVAAVGAFVAWVAADLPLPPVLGAERGRLATFLGGDRHLASSVAGAVVAAVALRALAMRWLAPSRLAAATATAVVVMYAGYLGVLRPALDPVKELRTGALAAAALVPEGEPLVGWRCDETTRAVLPFYSRRPFTNLETDEELVRHVESGRARHVILMRRSNSAAGPWKLPPPLRQVARPVGTVPLSTDREVAVFEVPGP